MTIKGSLETFSLPELFQMIESGKKSGRLTFEPESHAVNSNLTVTYELWFEKGSFVTIVNSLKQQFLTSRMINMGWIDIKILALKKLNCPPNKPIGRYLIEQNLIEQWQIDTLLLAQKREVIKLFKIESAGFNFEELGHSNSILNENISFPWEEMTGQQIETSELSLEGIREFPLSSRLSAEIPPENCALQRLVSHCNLQYDTLEKYLCNVADGSISLRKIAHKMEVSIDRVQMTALSMIMAGLVEEVPVISSSFNLPANATYGSSAAFAKPTNQRAKAKASNSLLKNLTNFLKQNF